MKNRRRAGFLTGSGKSDGSAKKTAYELKTPAAVSAPERSQDQNFIQKIDGFVESAKDHSTTIMSGADGEVHTLVKQYEYFFIESFNSTIPSHPEAYGPILGCAVLFGGLQLAQALYQNKQKMRRRELSYVYERLAKASASEEKTALKEFSGAEKNAISKEFSSYLSKGEFHGEYDVAIDSNGKLVLTAKGLKSKKTRDQFAKPSFYQEVTALRDEYPKTWSVSQHLFGFLCSYSFAYWIVTYTALIIGATISSAVTFGIPLIIPGLYAGWKLTKWIIEKVQEKLAPAKSTVSNVELPTPDQIEEDKEKLLRQYFIHSYESFLKNRMQELRKNIVSKIGKMKNISDRHGQKVLVGYLLNRELAKEKRVAATSNKPVEYLQFKSLKVSKVGLMRVVGFMAGFISSYFAAWPVSDILVTFFNIAAYGMVGTIITGAVTLLFGIGFSFYFASMAETQQKQLIEELERKQHAKSGTITTMKRLENERDDLLVAIKQEREVIAHMVHSYNTNPAHANKLTLREFSPIVEQMPGANDDKFFRTFETTSSRWRPIKKFLNRVKTFIESAGTGSLFIRATFGVSGILTLLGIVSLPIPIIGWIVLATAIVWGSVKLYKYILESKQGQETRLLKDTDTRTTTMESGNQLLKNELEILRLNRIYLQEPEKAPEPESEATVPTSRLAYSLVSTRTPCPDFLGKRSSSAESKDEPHPLSLDHAPPGFNESKKIS